MKKPRIAVTPRLSHEFIREGVNRDYMDALLEQGAIPYMIALGTEISLIVDDFDGLLVTGGEDIHPSFYKEDVTCSIECSTMEMDEFEIQLILAFIRAKKPILGICRGLQTINVALGGTLYQDLPSQYPMMRERGHGQQLLDPKPERNATEHAVTILPDTILNSFCEKELMVNTYHHQNIKDLASELIPSAISEDGLIEAAELKDQVLAVQWHPERLQHMSEHQSIFKWFCEKCKKKV